MFSKTKPRLTVGSPSGRQERVWAAYRLMAGIGDLGNAADRFIGLGWREGQSGSQPYILKLCIGKASRIDVRTSSHHEPQSGLLSGASWRLLARCTHARETSPYSRDRTSCASRSVQTYTDRHAQLSSGICDLTSVRQGPSVDVASAPFATPSRTNSS
jgi:hypothetical protein